MTDARQRKGRVGEEVACQFLQKLGLQIIHRNYRISRFEVDIICRHGDCLVFVEVKNSPSGTFGHPATWIDQRKVDRIRQAAQLYIEQNEISGVDIRFDAVTINRGEVEYYENAF